MPRKKVTPVKLAPRESSRLAAREARATRLVEAA